MFRFILFIICSFTYIPVYAITTANIKVSATIQKGCIFKESSVALDFGSYPTSSQEKNVTASILNDRNTWSLECTPDIPVSIVFGNGNNFDNTNQTRRLRNESGGFFIDYQIYSDINRSKVIGISSPSNTLFLKSNTSKNILDFGVYGLVDLSKGKPNKPSGKYLDEVLITVIW